MCNMANTQCQYFPGSALCTPMRGVPNPAIRCCRDVCSPQLDAPNRLTEQAAGVGWLLLCYLLTLSACNQPQGPLDAKERQRVDSIATAEIFQVRKQIADECQKAKEEELPRLVDSILSVRRMEIQRALQGVPN